MFLKFCQVFASNNTLRRLTWRYQYHVNVQVAVLTEEKSHYIREEMVKNQLLKKN